MDAELKAVLESELGSRVKHVRAVAGGNDHPCFRIVLADGRSAFVKFQRAAPQGLFAREAEGLRWLAAARALRVPEVLLVREHEPACLVLEWIEREQAAPDHDEQLGRGLAALHRTGADGFGFMAANFIATLPQDNNNEATWAAFYATRRLAPQLALAVENGRATRALRLGVERVMGRIHDFCGPAEAPARLHGDLWSGNSLTGPDGAPVLIDPAVYGGHREMDLAMMRLFGGFGPRCFGAYVEAYPLAAGHEKRVGLYQLYPLLVHANLFGGHYIQEAERVLQDLVGGP